LPSRCAFSSAWLGLQPYSSSAQLLLLVPVAVLVVDSTAVFVVCATVAAPPSAKTG
jgi:hypothetical protein